MKDLEARVAEAVKHFWVTREKQSKAQGSKTGTKDSGSRSAVTGGKQMDGFVQLVHQALMDGGLPDAEMIFTEARKRALPGYFRPTKDWDLIVIAQKQLLAVVEFKRHRPDLPLMAVRQPTGGRDRRGGADRQHAGRPRGITDKV